MTTFYAAPAVGVYDGTVPLVPGDASFLGGKVHSLISYIDLAANAVLSGDTIRWGRLPKGANPIGGFLLSSVSLGSSTVDVGTSTTAALFRAAATFTPTDTPTWFMKAANFGIPLAAQAFLQSVVAAANMPNSATNRLCLTFLYTTPHSG